MSSERRRPCASRARLGLWLWLVAGAACAPAQADNAAAVVTAQPGVLNLRTGDQDTGALPNLLHADAAFQPGRRYVVMLDGPLDPARAAALDGVGAIRRGYMPLNAVIADLPGIAPRALRALGFVRWVGEYQDAWRLDSHLNAGLNPQAWNTPQRQQLAANGLLAVNVWLFEGLADGPVQQALLAHPGARIASRNVVSGGVSLGVTIPPAALAALGSHPDVQYVEPQPEYAPRNNNVRSLIQSGVFNNTPLYNRGLTGAGQVMAIIDGWVATEQCAFSDPGVPIGPTHRKILAYNTTLGYDYHGTHVAGTAVGDSGSFTNNRGVAYGAKMVFNIWPNPDEPGHLERYELHASQGARVHNNSWGAEFRDYDGGCRGIDGFQFENDDNLLIFAVTDVSILVQNPENAKNCIAVMASGGQGSQNNRCIGGSGPTLDGRQKPDVGAPGCATVSANGQTGCGTLSLQGTSMAAPAVSGALVLARQYFTTGFYPSGQPNANDVMTPSGTLLKAVIMNGAADMTGVAGYPSMAEGWGRVIADNALYFTGDTRKLLVRDFRNASPEAMHTGDMEIHRVRVDAGQPLKVTLVWHDAPAQVNAAFAPVNDLDLVVTSPDGAQYRGNVFAAGQSTTGGTADRLNNVEMVLVGAPVAGTWQVQIAAHAVNQGTQGYALAVTGGVGEAPCRTDYNDDGNSDQGDVMALIQDIAAGTQTYPMSPDINEDGNIDQGDVSLLIDLIASTGC